MRRLTLALLILFLFAPLRGAFGKPCIVASIFPLYEIARGISSPEAEVYLLLPPGADPHSWEPTPKDILLLTRANILFVIGQGLEPWLNDLRKGLEKRHQKILLATEGAPLIHLEHHEKTHHLGVDPHIWLDFRWDAVLCERLADLLGQIDPVHQRLYRERARKLAEKFLKLDQAYRQRLAHCRSRKLVLAGHAAFGYLARNYYLKMISLAGLSPEAEPSPKVLAGLIKSLRKERVSAVFYEHPSSRRFAEVLANEIGAKILYLSPGASLTQEEIKAGISFFDLMYRNLDHLAQGLSCSQN